MVDKEAMAAAQRKSSHSCSCVMYLVSSGITFVAETYDFHIKQASAVNTAFKEKHLAKNPYVSLSYWDPEQRQVYAECRAEWEDDAAEKRRIWELYKSTPPPLGYDPGLIWQNGLEDPEFGLLKLTPWRVELWSLGDMISGVEPKVWRGA